eukprot:1161938-Amphidinium_carterae.1
MPAHWTPREAVTFSWRLKNPVPRHATVKDIKVVIDKLLKDLRLENASDTKVGPFTLPHDSHKRARLKTGGRNEHLHPLDQSQEC